MSPTYLTDEAKLVFINTLHYIAKFDHQPPLVRKIAGVPTRDQMRSDIDSLSEQSYANTLKRYKGIREDDAKRKADIRARIDEYIKKKEARQAEKDAGKTAPAKEEKDGSGWISRRKARRTEGTAQASGTRRSSPRGRSSPLTTSPAPAAISSSSGSGGLMCPTVRRACSAPSWRRGDLLRRPRRSGRAPAAGTSFRRGEPAPPPPGSGSC